MADENTTPVDKGLNAQGAAPADTGEENSGNGAPAPAAPPRNKAEAKAANPKPEDKGKETPKSDDEKAAEAAAAKEAEDAEKAKEAAEAENKPLDTDAWGDHGELANSALTLLQNAGMTPEETKALVFDALQAGDISKIDRDALVEKVGKEKTTLVMAGFTSFLNDAKAKAETILKDVHTTVGGEDNWKAVTTWAKENVSEADLAEYRSMIDAGGAQARFAASELASKYNGDANNTTLDAGAQEITGDSKPQSSGRTLSKLEYVAEMEKAHDNGASPAVIEEIKAARARGRAKGI